MAEKEVDQEDKNGRKDQNSLPWVVCFAILSFVPPKVPPPHCKMRILPASQVWHKPVWEHFANTQEAVRSECINTASTGHEKVLLILTPKKCFCCLKYKLNWCPVFWHPLHICNAGEGLQRSRVGGCKLCPGIKSSPQLHFCVLAPELRMDFTSIKGCKK